jgi:hypothetical protein
MKPSRAWVSKTPDGETIISEIRGSRVEVETRSGNVTKHTGCKPGEYIFARLVRAAREIGGTP